MNVREKIKSLVREEKKLLIQILDLLKFIEEGKLFLEWGFGSMFDYCTNELGYSEAAAQRRILAMRLLKKIPEVRGKMVDGSLSLTVAAQVQNFFKVEEKYRREANQPKLQLEIQKSVVNSILNLSSRQCERKLFEYSSIPTQVREVTKAISPTLTLIQFAADEELMKNIKKLQSLTSHTNYEGRYDLLFGRVTEIALEKLDPERQLARRVARENRREKELH